ncbi:MAG TPA: F0F1 ATP synthase subunit A [Solirubrobacteraceae bacterium]|nr:F0F1 ATP synthase subunit A [Solirubrobacteraceae bacterium]
MSRVSSLSKGRKIGYSVALVYLLGLIAFAVIFGIKGHKNESFKVIDSFHLESWFHIAGPLNFDKGVLYLLMATLLTLAIMLYVARHMQKRPGRTQVAVEMGYNLMSQVTRENMSEKLTKRWFPVVFTLFIFILVSNLIGYIPLPVDSQNTFRVFGTNIPSFQIYAAVTNVAVPLVLALGVFLAYNVEGVRAHGPWGYIKSLIPQGVGGPMLLLIFPLEMLSNFVLRPLSLTIRLWANLLAGHMLIDFMAGNLAVLLGLQLLGWFTMPLGVIIYLFEAVLIAGLQAFIFAILTAIYLGGATSASH